MLPGDLALVTDGGGHVLRDEPGSAAPDILDLERELVSERYEILRHGGGGAPSQLLCGAVRFDHPAARNLVDILPPVIKRRRRTRGWMQTTLALLAAEARDLQPGRRGGDHAARRHPRHPGHPRLARRPTRRRGPAGSARCRTRRSAARSR